MVEVGRWEENKFRTHWVEKPAGYSGGGVPQAVEYEGLELMGEAELERYLGASLS